MQTYTIASKYDTKEFEIKDKKLDHLLRFDNREDVYWENPECTYPKEAFWRLPIPREDGILPGDYRTEEPSLHVRKGITSIDYLCCLWENPEFFTYKLNEPHYFRRKDRKTGKQMRLTCYHTLSQFINDEKLCPDRKELVSPWHLAFLYTFNKELLIVVRCFYCSTLRAYTYEQLHPYVMDMEMNERLFHLSADYWEEEHPGETYKVKCEDTSCRYELYRWENAFCDKYNVHVTSLVDDFLQVDPVREFNAAYRLFSGYYSQEQHELYSKKYKVKEVSINR